MNKFEQALEKHLEKPEPGDVIGEKIYNMIKEAAANFYDQALLDAQRKCTNAKDAEAIISLNSEGFDYSKQPTAASGAWGDGV